MNWASVPDQLSASFPMWLPLVIAGFFGLILLITLARADKSVANVTLIVMTLFAIGIGATAATGAYGPTGRNSPHEARSQPVMMAGLPALSCIDDLAGDTILSACEKALFGSPESVAAAVSYTAAQIARLIALDDSAADRQEDMTPELKSLRRALEHDRYGLVAQALVARDNCTRDNCAAFRSLTNRQRIVANMDAHLFDDLVTRYSASWNAPTAPAVSGSLAGLPPSVPTGRPTHAEFPSAASTPPVSIMTDEPPTRQAPSGTTASTPARPAAAHAAAPPAPKKPPAAKKPPTAPVRVAPPPASAASNNQR